MSIRSELSDAIEAMDLSAIVKLHEPNDALLKVKPAFAGGSWMHFASAYSSPAVLAYLMQIGFSVDDIALDNGDRPLVCAANLNRFANARFLLDAGSVMDTSASVRNALFAAIVGKSPEIARLLLERGIDATVRYTSETMENMDATAFALMRGETEIARLVALHNAGGDETRAQSLLAEAKAIADKHGPLRAVRIVPTDEDLAERE